MRNVGAQKRRIMQNLFVFSIDSYRANEEVIELKRTSPSGKSQLTVLPLDDLLDL